jgi:hypothetical protein
MGNKISKSEKGIALIAVVVFTVILTLLGFSLLSMVNSEIVLARDSTDKTKAFYLAEAGVEVLTSRLTYGINGDINETSLGCGTYNVDVNAADDPPFAIATGEADGQERKIKVTVSFLAPPFECGVYSGGMSGTPWTLVLRGQGDPCLVYSSGTPVGNYGGRDIVNGNVFVDGNVAMYQQSSVNPAPYPNDYELDGDVDATGDIDRYDSAYIAGEANDHAPVYSYPDLIGMNYAVNNTHNVAQIFADAHISTGPLPSGNVLRDIFQRNPGNMTAECATTSGNDYFLTPVSGFIEGKWDTAETPINVGNNRVYYVDGDVWIHSKSTFGFKITGKATIVATGNIHVSDNFVYADSSSMLGLVALGRYDSNTGALISGGDVVFGDPTYGTMYEASAMMFAANNFLYNSTAIGTFSAEPESGFIINGSLAALNHVSIERDWYTRASVWDGHKYVDERRPARYDPITGKWYDSGTGVELTSTQISTMKHYQMIINYDDRVRSRDTQPPGLPRGIGYIFGGITHWEEIE